MQVVEDAGGRGIELAAAAVRPLQLQYYFWHGSGIAQTKWVSKSKAKIPQASMSQANKPYASKLRANKLQANKLQANRLQADRP